MMLARCPFCQELVQEGAVRCGHCGSWVREYKLCPQCGEAVAEKARLCHFCRYQFEVEEKKSPLEQQGIQFPLVLVANRLGALFGEGSLTALLLPPELRVEPGELRISKWGLLGLRRFGQRISLDKVASVRFHQGVFWAELIIETYGGGIADLRIRGLNKQEGEQMAKWLDILMAEHPGSVSK